MSHCLTLIKMLSSKNFIIDSPPKRVLLSSKNGKIVQNQRCVWVVACDFIPQNLTKIPIPSSVDCKSMKMIFFFKFLSIVVLLELSAMAEIRKSLLSWRIVKKTCLLLPLASTPATLLGSFVHPNIMWADLYQKGSKKIILNKHSAYQVC